MKFELKILFLLFCLLSCIEPNLATPFVVQENASPKKEKIALTKTTKPTTLNRFQKWKAKFVQRKIEKKMQRIKDGKQPIETFSLLGFIAAIATLLFIIPESLRFIFLILGPITLALGIVSLFKIRANPDSYRKISKVFAITATVIGGLASLFFLVLRLSLFNV